MAKASTRWKIGALITHNKNGCQIFRFRPIKKPARKRLTHETTRRHSETAFRGLSPWRASILSCVSIPPPLAGSSSQTCNTSGKAREQDHLIHDQASSCHQAMSTMAQKLMQYAKSAESTLESRSVGQDALYQPRQHPGAAESSNSWCPSITAHRLLHRRSLGQIERLDFTYLDCPLRQLRDF